VTNITLIKPKVVPMSQKNH